MVDRISLTCFGASYVVALAFDCLYLKLPMRLLRVFSLGFTVAGLVAQTTYLACRQPALVEPFGYFLFLAWILAVVHLVRVAPQNSRTISLFTLPLVILLVFLAWFLGGPSEWGGHFLSRRNPLINTVHVGGLIGASVTMSLGFIASCMYLARSWQLRSKHIPGWGLKLPSLENLEIFILSDHGSRIASSIDDRWVGAWGWFGSIVTRRLVRMDKPKSHCNPWVMD